MSAARDLVYVALESHGCKPKRNGEKLTARCPCHDDRRESLSGYYGTENPNAFFLKCHAGCSREAIVEKLDLTMADLFDDSGNGCVKNSSTLRSTYAHKNDGQAARRIVAEYDYRDESGARLFQAVRYEPKDFRQRRPDGNGGWTWNMKGVRRVLYGLPELLAADVSAPVFIVEGEKDSDNLRALSLVATCNPMGAGKWQHVEDAPLQGRPIVIVPDADEAGEKHAQDVAGRLHGRAASVRVLRLPVGKDASDFLQERDADGKDATAIRRELEDLAAAAPEWEPAPQALAREKATADYVSILTRAAEAGRERVPSGAPLAKLCEELGKSAADVDGDYVAVRRYLELAVQVPLEHCDKASQEAASAYERHLSIRTNYADRRGAMVEDGNDAGAIELDRTVRALMDAARVTGAAWAELEAKRIELDNIARERPEMFPRHIAWERPSLLRTANPDLDLRAPADFPTNDYGPADDEPPPVRPAATRRTTGRPDRPGVVFLLSHVSAGELLGVGTPGYFDDEEAAKAAIDRQAVPTLWYVERIEIKSPAVLGDLAMRGVTPGNIEGSRPLFEDWDYRPPAPPQPRRNEGAW